MALTVRLDPRTERALNALAKRRGASRSDIVREALVRYQATDGGEGTTHRPFDSWFDVIGVVSLGARDPGRTTGQQMAALVRRHRPRRRAR